MWSFEPNDVRAKLDLSKIRSDFKQVTDNGLTLVCPKRNVWDWNRRCESAGGLGSDSKGSRTLYH